MSIRKVAALALVLASSACGLDQEDFATEYAALFCEINVNCAGIPEDRRFDLSSVQACEADVKETLMGFGSGENCKYDGGDADDVLVTIRGATCESYAAKPSDYAFSPAFPCAHTAD